MSVCRHNSAVMTTQNGETKFTHMTNKKQNIFLECDEIY